MTLNLFSDYSLRILMYAALREAEQFSVDEAAKAYGLSRHHTAKVVNFLAKRGYLKCKRGRGGGVALGKPAGEVRIGEVLRQTEGGPPLVECFDAASNTCPLIHACVLKRALAEALAAFFNSMDKITLAQLVERPESMRRALSLQP
jgi:Rrf2 family nitric oxide-sensitive transcriptional repressor